jgi:hypothetical protein
VNTGPDDFETPLSFELHDADVQFLIQNNSRRGARVGRGDDLGNALVQRSLQNCLGRGIRRMRCYEPQLDRIMTEIFGNLGSHLRRMMQNDEYSLDLDKNKESVPYRTSASC